MVLLAMGGHKPTRWIVQATAKRWCSEWATIHSRERTFMFMAQALAYCKYYLRPRGFGKIKIWVTKPTGWCAYERDFEYPVSFWSVERVMFDVDDWRWEEVKEQACKLRFL